MRTIVEDPITRDWYLTGTTADYYVNDARGIAQTIADRLALWQGEWWLDQSAGMAWLTAVLGYNTQSLYDPAIREQILGTEGVSNITAYSSSLNKATRRLTVDYTVQTIYGSVSNTVPLAVAAGFGISPYGSTYGE